MVKFGIGSPRWIFWVVLIYNDWEIDDVLNKVIHKVNEINQKINIDNFDATEDLVINAMDLAKRNPRNTGGKILGSLHRNCAWNILQKKN